MDLLNDLRKVRDILSRIDYKTLTTILDSYVPSIPMAIFDFDNRPNAFGQWYAGGNNLLYRGRLITDPEKKPFSEFNQINYIGKENLDKIIKYGRVNKPGESMFYASTKKAIACLETFTKEVDLEHLGDNSLSLFVQVGIWKIETSLVLARMPIPENDFATFLNKMKMLNLEQITLDEVQKQNAELRGAFSNEEHFKILEFFAEEFAKIKMDDNNGYKLSNYYADRVFNRNSNFDTNLSIDGIMYPSVPSSYQELNIVLPPSIVDSKLRFLWSDFVWVTINKKRGVRFNTIEQRAKVNDKGVIEWRRFKPN